MRQPIKYVIFKDTATDLWNLYHVHGWPGSADSGGRKHDDFATSNWRTAMWVATGDSTYAPYGDGPPVGPWRPVTAMCGARTLRPLTAHDLLRGSDARLG